MNIRRHHTTITRRLAPVGLAGLLIASLAAVPSGALATTGHASAARAQSTLRDTPSQVIDATTDPEGAAKELNSGCADLSHCSWSGGTPAVGWGPSKIIGDVLYNCSEPENPAEPTAGPNSETEVGVSDERTETTSISEKVSLKISLGFLGFEKTSAEFEAFSKQANSFSTGVTVGNAVVVPPGYKGWTEAKPRSILVSGDAYVTSGINGLVEVKGLDLSYPFPDPNNPLGNALYVGTAVPMTTDELNTRCDAVNGLGAVRRVAETRTTKLTACRATSDSRGLRCETLDVTGAPAPRKARATVLLTRDDRTYATGTDIDGHIRLITDRRITAGKYNLTLRQPPVAAQIPRLRTLTVFDTIIPVTVR